MTTSWRHNCHATTKWREPKTLRRKFGRFRLVSMRARRIFGWGRWRYCKDYLQGVKQFCEIRIARQEGHWKSKQNLSEKAVQIHQIRTSLFNVVLSYWLERPGKLNSHSPGTVFKCCWPTIPTRKNLGHPPFFSFSVECVFWYWVGRSDWKKRKLKKES